MIFRGGKLTVGMKIIKALKHGPYKWAWSCCGFRRKAYANASFGKDSGSEESRSPELVHAI